MKALIWIIVILAIVLGIYFTSHNSSAPVAAPAASTTTAAPAAGTTTAAPAAATPAPAAATPASK